MKVHYDEEVDVLYLAREGQEEQVIEVHPGINLELDSKGDLIGVEILRASLLLKGVIEPLRDKAIRQDSR
ncbi:MAG: DUF2283 domain-containing protein [Chloroflexi bacterium]|nr:DUF2283 domain-containing protein [Chloroflexota bacterium]